MLVTNTPVEPYMLPCGIRVLVKREDLCCPPPGPPFSKMRGVVAHLRHRPEATIGVLDTYHSKAGWAVAYACRALGKRTINYWPRYTTDSDGILREPQQAAAALGAATVAVPAGRSAILYHRASADLKDRGNLFRETVYMMPNALKLTESVDENAAEARRTLPLLPPAGTLVISISSGTVAAGVLRGFGAAKYTAVLHMGYSRSHAATRDYIDRMATAGQFFQPLPSFRLVDEGYAYGDRVDVECPFPCNPWYDAKAFLWLKNHAPTLAKPIVFWSIGA